MMQKTSNISGAYKGQNIQLSFKANDQQTVKEFLNDKNNRKYITELTKLSQLSVKDSFYKKYQENCANIMGKLKESLSKTIISNKLKNEKLSKEEVNKINEINARPVFEVYEGERKDFAVRSAIKSILVDIDTAIKEKDESKEYFAFCLTSAVNGIRVLQRTLGVPEKSTADITKVNDNLDELI